ncbi:NADPH-dependent FMN reductase [Vulgatibacter sp.]|uniref:NADPH-dependent FMN reductase n=1 Tax=Vulgatibacter sp. TaxID=1971226 RepID=UPI0035652C4F
MRILCFGASLRRDSLNARLASLAADVLRRAGADVDRADFAEFEMPIYDGDVDASPGPPPGAVELCMRVRQAEALVLACPEYNYSIAGPLKNAIDWVSRFRPMPWRGKSVYLLAASPSPMGGIRGLWQTRVPFEACGALVFPDMFALAHADKAFDAQGRIADRALQARLERELTGFLRLAERIAPICDEDHVKRPTREQLQIAAALEEESEVQPPSH